MNNFSDTARYALLQIDNTRNQCTTETQMKTHPNPWNCRVGF